MSHQELLYTVNQLAPLPIEQLAGLRKNIAEELKQFTTAFESLKEANERLYQSSQLLHPFNTEEEDTPVLVPLTRSLYVSGKLANSKKVMVDLGSGYFVEKDVKGAQEVLKRKGIQIVTSMKQVQARVIAQEKNIKVIDAVLTQKLENQKKLK